MVRGLGSAIGVLEGLDKNIEVNRREFMELHENFKLDTAENYLE